MPFSFKISCTIEVVPSIEGVVVRRLLLLVDAIIHIDIEMRWQLPPVLDFM